MWNITLTQEVFPAGLGFNPEPVGGKAEAESIYSL
jgi:hypothetical protein